VTGKVSLEELDSLPFTLNDLKKVIPVRCFEKNLLISLYYMARDWLVVYILYCLSDSFFSLGFVGKFIWWNITGFFGWCLFVVGHDCGHGSFSNYPLLNDILGHLNHAPLCVPFHGWRISHRSHHQYHNDVDNDHSWRPLNKTGYEYSGIIPTFLFRYTPLLLFLYPVYLTRESRDAGFSGNHFNP
jgi:omega-3 fatty acid desaturase (delta-15 desaturase)